MIFIILRFLDIAGKAAILVSISCNQYSKNGIYKSHSKNLFRLICMNIQYIFCTIFNALYAFLFSFAVSVQTLSVLLSPFSYDFSLYAPVYSVHAVISIAIVILCRCLFPTSVFLPDAASFSDFCLYPLPQYQQPC